jgi:hypothetical protein
MFVLPITRRAVLQQRSRSLALFASRACFTRRFPLLSHLSWSPTRQLSTLSPQASAPSTWVDRLPPKIRPYLHLIRIDKPIGTSLLFYPCGTLFSYSSRQPEQLTMRVAWSIMMASYSLQAPITTPLTYISLCGIGALVLRGAGCTINDMWDKDLDKAVGASLGVIVPVNGLFTNEKKELREGPWLMAI